MTEYVALLQSQYLAMEEMKVASTNGCSSDLYDDIVWFCDVWHRSINHSDISGSKPGKSFHLRAICAGLVFWLDISGFGTHTLKDDVRKVRTCEDISHLLH